MEERARVADRADLNVEKYGLLPGWRRGVTERALAEYASALRVERVVALLRYPPINGSRGMLLGGRRSRTWTS
jgi:hypothetical protein